jgi:hypothetical protein
VLPRHVDFDGGCLWDDSNVLNTIVADLSLESGLSLGTLGEFRLGEIWTWEEFKVREILGWDMGKF